MFQARHVTLLKKHASFYFMLVNLLVGFDKSPTAVAALQLTVNSHNKEKYFIT